jgi:hypothetical protein
MMKKFTLLFTIMLTCALAGFSQSGNTGNTAAEQVFFVQCDDINFDKYTNLHNRLKNDGRYTIATACIPAHVLTIKVSQSASLNATVESNYNAFRELASLVEIDQMQLLANYNTQMFESQCRSARTGN